MSRLLQSFHLCKISFLLLLLLWYFFYLKKRIIENVTLTQIQTFLRLCEILSFRWYFLFIKKNEEYLKSIFDSRVGFSLDQDSIMLDKLNFL